MPQAVLNSQGESLPEPEPTITETPEAANLPVEYESRSLTQHNLFRLSCFDHSTLIYKQVNIEMSWTIPGQERERERERSNVALRSPGWVWKLWCLGLLGIVRWSVNLPPVKGKSLISHPVPNVQKSSSWRIGSGPKRPKQLVSPWDR